MEEHNRFKLEISEETRYEDEEISKSQAEINEELYGFMAEFKEEVAQFRAQHNEEMADIRSKLDTMMDLLHDMMKSEGLEPPDRIGAPLDHLNADPEESTLVSMAENSKPMAMQNWIGHSSREPVDDRILVVNEMPDSKGIINCESTIKHSIDEENEQDEENDDNGCGMLSFVYVQSILGFVCESSKIGSTNGSHKACVKGVSSRMDVVLGQNAMKEDVHLMFDKMTKAIPIDVFEDDKGMKSYQNNYSSIRLQAEPCSTCLHFRRDNNLIYAAFVEIQNVILITDIEVLFYFDPGGCSLPQMGCCDPFEFNGEQRDLCLNANMPDISVKAIIRKLRTRIASVCGVNVYIDRAFSASGLYMFVQIGMGQKGHCIRDVDRSSWGGFIAAFGGNIINGGSVSLYKEAFNETLVNDVKLLVHIDDQDLFVYFDWIKLAWLLLSDRSTIAELEMNIRLYELNFLN